MITSENKQLNQNYIENKSEWKNLKRPGIEPHLEILPCTYQTNIGTFNKKENKNDNSKKGECRFSRMDTPTRWMPRRPPSRDRVNSFRLCWVFMSLLETLVLPPGHGSPGCVDR